MKKLLLLLFILLSMLNLKAETFKAGSYIIDMGVIPQTYVNGLQPYGTVYDFVINHEVPLYWIIRSGKKLYQKDFTYPNKAIVNFTFSDQLGKTYTQKDYKGSAFVIPAIYVTADINATIAEWRTKGVVIDGPTTVDFDADVFNYISSFPNAVVDKANEGLVRNLFYGHTEIPENYYTTGTPADITACSDVYALPHADPQKWSDDDKATYLDYIIGEAKGFLWQGCHSVGAVEAHDPYLAMFILTTNGQIAWSNDPDYDFSNTNSPNYEYDYDAGDDPIMQIASPLDDSTIPSLVGPKADFSILEDVNITVQNEFEIKKDAQDLNISTHVIIHCKKFILGENVTINIVSGGSLTIIAQEDSQCNKNSSIVTDSPEQFVFMGLGKLQLGDDGGIESYDGFYYAQGELKLKKATTVNGAVTSNDKISLGETDPTKPEASLVIYDAAAAAKVDTSPPVTNGYTDAALFPQDMYVVSDVNKPNFNMVAPSKEDGVLDYAPVEISENQHYDKIQIPEHVEEGDGDKGSSALQDGSQEIYIPRPDSAWRSTTTVGIWEKDNVNNSLNGGNPNKAALIAFGRAYGLPENGILVQHASHSASTGTESQNVTSGRIYGNLLLQSSIEKRPIIQMIVPPDMTFPNSYQLQSTVQRGAKPYKFKWTTACGGSFNDITLQNPVYTPDNNDTNNCIMRVKVEDNCTRKNFATQITNIHGYHPPLGQFNITHENETFSATGKDTRETLHPDNALYTQITNKAFNVTLVALNEADKETLQPTYGNLIFEAVNTTGIIEDDPKSCALAQRFEDLTDTIATDGNGLHFNNSSLVQATGITYPNAWKRLTFRVWHYDFVTQEDRSYGIPVSYSSDKLNADFPNASANCGGTINSWDCYNSIAQIYGKAVCARDQFAVRPDSYTIALPNPPYFGGISYPYTVTAIANGGATDSGYTTTITSAFDDNTFVSQALIPPTGCDLNTSAFEVGSSLFFNSGNSVGSNGQSATFTYNNVGDINLVVHDGEWTEWDQNKSYSGGKSNDCILNSNSSTPTNGLIGCNLEVGRTMTFLASGFSNVLSVKNFNDDTFTYVAPVENNTSEMYAQVELNITAVLADGVTRATNYTSECFANDIDYDLSFIPPTPAIILGWGTPQSRIQIFTNGDGNTSLKKEAELDTTTVITTADFDSIKKTFRDDLDLNGNDRNGTSTQTLRFNFDRRYQTPDNPFRISATDFNITVTDGVTTGSGLASATGRATFRYARTRASRFFYDGIGGSSVNTPISVDIYCDGNYSTCNNLGVNTNSGQIDEAYWWTSIDHNMSDDHGDIKLARKLPVLEGTSADWDVLPKDVTINSVMADTSIVVSSGSSPTLPLTVAIDVDPGTDKWMVYNPDWPMYRPLYKVRFIGGAGWAGVGNTGYILDSNASSVKTKRLDW